MSSPYDPNGPTNPQYPQYPQQGGQPGQPGYGQQSEYPTPQQPPQPGYGQSGNPPPPPYQPGYPPQQPDYGQPGYPPPQQPDYGQAGYPPPQPGYGQPAYPTQPGYPGAQYQGYPGYPVGPQPGMPGAPGQPPRRSNAGRTVGIIVGVVVVLIVACLGGLYVIGTRLQGAASSFITTMAPTETALAQQLTPSPSDTIAYQDSLMDSPTGWASDTHCQFKSDGYYVSGGYACLGPEGVTPATSDVSVTVKGINPGQDTGYGVVVRHASNGNFYSFEITPDGQWAFLKFVNHDATAIVQPQSSAAIHTGAGATNDLKVAMTDSNFVFYVNGQQVGAIDDSTFTQGDSGVFNDDSTTSNLAIFTNFIVSVPNQ